jgi:Tfp pilus assembly protein PilF
MSTNDPRETAAEYLRKGYEARDFYSRSIVAYPTPEAFTFRGWMYSLSGDFHRAIYECFEAIKLDPNFGNPFNDIGEYLIEQGKWEHAIPWFEKAIDAKRYFTPSYPYFNLGRAYEHLHDFAKAKASYARAHEINQRCVDAVAGLRRMRAAFN